MREKNLAKMRDRMLRETQVFLNLHLNDRVPRFHNEPSLPRQAVVPRLSRSIAGVGEVADSPGVGLCDKPTTSCRSEADTDPLNDSALNGYKGSNGRQTARNPAATWVIPTEDEWYTPAVTV